MKKVLSLITLLMCTMAATAASYTGQLIVGSVENSKATATVTQNGDTYTLAAGSYSLTGLTGTTAAGVTTLKQNGTVVARFNASTLYANFTQGGNQVEFTTAGFQLNNRGFEAWHDVSVKPSTTTYSGSEPNGWHGFLSSNGTDLGKFLYNTAVGAVKSSLTKTTENHSGSNAALLTAGGTSILGKTIVANGTMSTGRMNMGSTSAANTKNHAYIDKSNTDANGDPFYTSITNFPDAVTAWVKGSVTNTMSNMSAILVSSGSYQDPQDENTTYNNIVAKAKNDDGNISPTSAWQQVSENFDYSKGTTTAAPKYLLLTISTSATPGGGAMGDKLYVDDIYLVYNAGEVTGITCSKFEGFTFDAATTEYDVTYTGSDALTEADINATFANLGKGAITGTTVETTATGYRAVVAIYNQELSKAVEYVINANVPNELYLIGSFNGWDLETAVPFTLAADGKFTLTHQLAAGGFKMVTDVADAWNNTYYGPANDKTMTLGTAEALVENGGGNYLIAEDGTYTITVDLTAMTVTLTGTPAPVELTGVAFSEANHYATWYGDKDLALPEPLKAYVVTAINADEATITQVDYIPAGVAVLLQNDGTGSSYSAPRYIGATQTVTSLLAGSNEATTVSEGYVLFNDEFVMSDSGTLAAHRCYLPAANAAGAPARLRIGKGGGVVTAIDNVNAARVAGVKYVSLDGRVSDKPFTGVNVVVKTLTDGTTTVTKVVK